MHKLAILRYSEGSGLVCARLLPFMNSVARSFVAGLALAALARLGVAAAVSLREGPAQLPQLLTLLAGGYSPSEGSPPVAASSGSGSSRWSSDTHLAPQQPSARQPRGRSAPLLSKGFQRHRGGWTLRSRYRRAKLVAARGA